MNPRAFLSAAILALAASAGAGEPPERLQGGSCSAPCGGVWRMMPGGAVFSVKDAGRQDTYTMRLLDSPDFTAPAGATIGTLRATARPATYDAEIYSKPGSGRSAHHFIVEVDERLGRMYMRAYDPHGRISLRRWIPYFFRAGYREGEHPDELDGAVRIAPRPAGPVIL